MCAKPASPLGEKHIFENQSVKLGMIFKQYEPVPKNIASEVVEKRIKEGKVRPMAD